MEELNEFQKILIRSNHTFQCQSFHNTIVFIQLPQTLLFFGAELIKNFIQQAFYVCDLRGALQSIAFRYFDFGPFADRFPQLPMADLPDIRFT